MKHTPGPWCVKKDSDCYGYSVIAKGNKSVASFVNEADAHLIAAAPEMKGLLYKAHEKLADLNNNYELGDDNPVDLCFEIRNILHYIEGQAWLEEGTE